jgi:pyruvate/2-oxoglutarate dehydrogenase complex dihydrolipoamide acyltransferase (E2) component
LENSDIVATPFVRGLIKKHKIDVAKIKGTGQGGRILEVDIENYLNKKHETKA